MRERRTLDRVLSRAGAMSRKQAEEAIRAGRVRVNGVRVRDPATWVDLPQDRVALDDRPLRGAELVHLALHKPAGYATTRSDERGRATVYELIEDVEAWVAPVGRLDRDTSGLLLFTNDTEWADLVTSPRSKLAKRYLCIAKGEMSQEKIEALRCGVELEDGRTRPAEIEVLGRRGVDTHLALSITEGRNRQVRRMLTAVGSRVLELQRVAIGAIELGALAEGRWRALSSREIRSVAGAARRD
jgi:pseudouridine synthase